MNPSSPSSSLKEAPPTTIFISYSHRNQEQKIDLERYLNGLLARKNVYVRFSSDAILAPGDNWRQRLEEEWHAANIFLVLVSADYLVSKTKEPELDFILSEKRASQVQVLPIILEESDWQSSRIAKFQALPKFGKAISSYDNRQAAYTEIGEAILNIISYRRNLDVVRIIRQERQEQTGVLHLEYRKLTVIPRDLLDMPWLRELYLNDNEIHAIEHLEHLTALERLSLAGNKLARIENLEALQRLTFLDLQGNAIRQLGGLEHNHHLQELGLSSNQLERLSGLEPLQNLRTLYAGHNALREVDELEQLLSLRRIILTNNKIQSIRPLLGHLEAGLEVVAVGYSSKSTDEGIYLTGNPMEEPAPEVVAKGRAAVIEYFKNADTYGIRKLEIVKLILVGNSGVGKTNFSQFLRGKRLTPVHNSTHLLDIQGFKAPFLKTESGKPMHVNVFDFGGQDYYHDSHRMYYSHDTMYVLLWDTATNKHSEEADALPAGSTNATTYDNFPLEYWLESIKYNLRDKSRPTYGSQDEDEVQAETKPVAKAGAPEKAVNSAPIFVLQNKVDVTEGPLNQQALLHDYPNIVGFFNTSLKARKRTKVLLEVLGDYMSKLNFSGRKLINFEYKIVERFMHDTQPLRTLSLLQFQEECTDIIQDSSVDFTLDNAQIIADILNSLGVVFYDKGADGDGLIFTRIDEFNQAIKDVMLVAKRGHDKGFFRLSQVAGIPNHAHIIDLLLRNNSIISVSATTFLAPQFLPRQPEPGIAFLRNAFAYCNMRFVYKAYFHKSLLLKLFAEYLKDDAAFEEESNTQSFPFWRNGIIISKGMGATKQMVLVEFEKEADKGVIYIKTMGPFNKNGLEREVEGTLDKLNKELKVSKEVAVDSMTFFDVDRLQTDVRNRIFEFSGGETLKKSGGIEPTTDGPKEMPAVFNVHQFKQLVDFGKTLRKLFISYSSRNAEFVRRFVTHLEVLKGQGLIVPWYDRMIGPGAKWDDTIRDEMAKSDIVIFLLSPDFLATDYIMKTEVPQAIKRFDDAKAKLFFIELQPCGWQLTDIAKHQQSGNPDETAKNIISIGEPTNDAQWNRVIKELMTIL